MTLDSEDQRKILLELIAASTVPGKAIDILYDLQRAIRSAEVPAAP
jgi:hypothetical protein